MNTSPSPTQTAQRASFQFRNVFALFLLLLAFAATSSVRADIWGNTYQLNNANSSVVTSVNSQWITFTATEDMVVSGTAYFASNAAPGTPTVLAEIFGVDGNGTPTGGAISSGSFNSVGAGSHYATMSSGTLSASSVYAVQLSTTGTGSFFWRLNFGPTGGIQPFGDADEHWFRGINAGLPTEGMNVFYLDTDLGRTVGQPYVSTLFSSIVSSTSTIGQSFKFDATAAGGNLVQAIRMRLDIGATAPSELVTVKLIDDTGSVLATGTRDLSGAAAGVDDFTFTLNTSTSLTDGEDYFVGAYSNGSAAGSVDWMAYATANDAAKISASFQGADAHILTWGSQSDYTGSTTDVGYRDYAFGLDVIPEPTSLLLLLGGGALFAFRRSKIRV